MPERIQRRRSKGWRMPEGAVYVGRPTKWGNPFPVKKYGEIAVEMFAERLMAAIEQPWFEPHDIDFRIMAESIEELRGKDLVCWCHWSDPCHADVLLELAKARPVEETHGKDPR